MIRLLMEVKDLKKHFPVKGGILQRVTGFVRAVDGLNFEIERGEVFGLVGESGCGKTTLGRACLRLIEPTSGEVRFEDVDLLNLNLKDMQKIKYDIN